MSFDERAKTKALAIVKIFETSKPFGDYAAVAVLNDGAGISYGTSQFTHRSGSLHAVIKRYVELGGTMPATVADAMPDFASGRRIPSRSADASLKNALRRLGKTAAMQQAQREIAFEKYLKPALDACEGSNFILPLSLAVIYDSKNHGSYDKIRDKVQIDAPGNGSMPSIDFEKAWITQYVQKRDAWLESVPRLAPTDYRTDFFLAQISRGNWRLDLPLNVHGFKLTEELLFPNSSAELPADETVASETDLDPALASNSSGVNEPPSSGQPPASGDASGAPDGGSSDGKDPAPPEGTKTEVTETSKATTDEAGGTVEEKSTETKTQTFTPKNIPAFIPRFGKKWFLGLFPGAGIVSTWASYLAGLPPWMVFTIGFLTGVAMVLFFQLLIRHWSEVQAFIRRCYASMANPEENNLIPTPAEGFFSSGTRRNELVSMLAPAAE